MLFPCNVLFKQRSQFNEAPFSFHSACGSLPGMVPTSGLTGSAHGCDPGAPAIVICFLGHGGYVSYRQNSSTVFAIFLATGAWGPFANHFVANVLSLFFFYTFSPNETENRINSRYWTRLLRVKTCSICFLQVCFNYKSLFPFSRLWQIVATVVFTGW